MSLRYFPAAREDIKETLRGSAANFGRQTTERYKKLLTIALLEIERNPLLKHSYEVRGLQPGFRLYHLKHSRERAAEGGRMVREPRHFIAYSVLKGETVIIRVLHERMEISRQLDESLDP